jgi:leukocyte elastase inhibitor
MTRYIVVAALFLSACSIVEPYLPLAAPEGSFIGTREGERPPAIGAGDPSASQARALTAAYNASGHDLFKRLADKPGNILLSPYSIGTAMAMLLSGARGDTEKEMAAVLRHSLARPEIAEANGRALAILNGYDKAQLFSPRPARLRAANALMLTKAGGDIVAPSYAALLKDRYAAEVFRDADVARVNAWVSERTEGKIKKILDRLDPATALAVLNAVYFKASWQWTFRKADTRDEDFNLSASAKVRVPTMRQHGDFRVLAGSGYRAIQLPYSVKALSMVIVLPDTIDGATALARRLDAKEMARMLAGPKKTSPVALAMPRFKAAFKTSLVSVFREMGMTRPFDEGRADFSGITGGATSAAPIVIDQVVHSAVIEVDEEGTEAAGATVGSAVVVSAPPPPQIFNIDRPFLFYIVDDATGAILFLGRISDPRQA